MITPLPAGSTFAGYKVDAILARGGMGVVYLATELRPRRRVALKLIAPALAADAAYRERFLREVDSLAALEHPNVVPIHAAGEWEGQLYLAMRYLDGPDLAEVVRTRGPLPPARALALLEPIADALDVAHARGIVHRDVTPANIRLDARGVPYLTDFGLTRRAATGPAANLTLGPMGTPSCMAPEQLTAPAGGAPAATGAADLETRVDVYALGCVLVTLLTGAPPYPRDTYEAALWAHVNAPPPSLVERQPALPRAVDAVIARALAKEPAARFATAGALVAAARAALAPVAPGAPAPGAASAAGPGPGGSTATVPAPAAPAAARAPAPRRARSGLAKAARAVALVALLALAAGSGIGAGILVAGSLAAAPGATASPPAAAAPTERPTARPTPRPTPTPTPVPTPTPAPTPRFGSPEDVARLRAWIPQQVRRGCDSAEVRYAGEIAALRCSAKDAQAVRYGLYVDATALQRRWDAFVERVVDAPGGRCEAGEEAAGSWGDEGLFGLFGETRGLVVCSVEADGDARVDWTTDDAPIWATLWRSDEDIAAAYATWSEGRLHPLRAPR